MPRTGKFQLDLYKSGISLLITILGFFLLQFYLSQKELDKTVDEMTKDMQTIKTELHLYGIDVPLPDRTKKTKEGG